jgi:hypothetical protein
VGDSHRDHDLRQVGAVILGVTERPLALLDRPTHPVVINLVLQIGQLVRHLDLPVGRGGIHEDDVQIKI